MDNQYRNENLINLSRKDTAPAITNLINKVNKVVKSGRCLIATKVDKVGEEDNGERKMRGKVVVE